MNKNILGPLKTTIEAIDFEGIKKFFSDLFADITGFLSSILKGDWETASIDLGSAFNSIFSVIGSAVSNFFTTDATAGGKAGSQTFVQGLATAIASAVQGAVTLALGTLATALGLDTTTFFADMKAAFDPLVQGIQTGDPLTIVGDIGGAIVDAIKAAIQLALDGLEKAFGVDLTPITDNVGSILDTVKGVFTNPDGTTILTDVAGTFTNVADAVTLLFSRLQNVTESQAAQDLLNTTGDVVERIANVVGTAVTVPLTALSNTFSTLASLDTGQTIGVINALIALFALKKFADLGGFTGLINGLSSLPAGIAGTLGSIKTGYQAIASTTLAKGAAIFVIVDFLSNLAKALKDFQSDHPESILTVVLDAITGFAHDLGLIDLAASVADALGLSGLADGIRNVQTTVSQLKVVIKVVLAQLGATWPGFALDIKSRFELAANDISLAIQIRLSRARPGTTP